MEPTIRRLIRTRYSPWSERAAWVLDHHGLAYEAVEHVPFIGERRLRKIVGPEKKRVSVPVLIAGDEKLTESWDIALYADREGKGPKLIPLEQKDEIRRWNDLADEVMAAGRVLVLRGILANPQALDEGLPPSFPRLLRPLLRPVGRRAMHWFARKYEARLEDAPAQQARVRAGLTTLRAALAKSSPYLLGTFSYADIVMATGLQGVSPVDGSYIRLGPATRKAWTQEEIAAEFPDLIEWRNQLYERHRGERSRV